jgi:5-methylcytosine-specific restriction endonuclease McrA
VVRAAIKRTNNGSTSKGGKTFENLPYTPKMLKEHLESQFDENMSWDNYGTYWHIDHIIPQAMTPYDTIKHENFQKAWALENLQPLEARENMSKNSIHNGEKKYYKDHK